ncbi:MAG: hypothetical protein LBC75_00620 [Fibromonadaceae bacterium]|nr:hypothetical protein [Fibromonadaceae bacterium]
MAALFLISCSDSDKFKDNNEFKIDFYIFYESFEYRNKPYIYVYANISPRGGEEDYYYYYWIIDEERFYEREVEINVPYGEHFVKFVLIDSFGDVLSESAVIRVDEPLKIAQLSPIQEYKAARTDTIKFQYKISGIDKWEEEPQVMVYVSKDEDVWENGKPIKDNFLAPPFNEQVYYWGVKALAKQDTAFSEIRSVWIKN